MSYHITASRVLEAVERWATGCWVVREIELLGERAATAEPVTNNWNRAQRQREAVSAGRLDALLVPTTPYETPWAKKIGGWCLQTARLIGVEVKVSIADFKVGLKTGQFDRYADQLGGLYIATPAGMVKSSDVPANFGHLVVSGSWGEERAVCKRHPTLTAAQPTPEMFWKLLSVFMEQQRALRDEMRQRIHEGCQRAGKKLAAAIAEAAWKAGKATVGQ